MVKLLNLHARLHMAGQIVGLSYAHTAITPTCCTLLTAQIGSDTIRLVACSMGAVHTSDFHQQQCHHA